MTILLKWERFYAIDTYPLNDVFDGERGLADAFDDELVMEKGPGRLRDKDLSENIQYWIICTKVGGGGGPKGRGGVLF